MSTKRQMYYEDMQNLFDINQSIAVDIMTNLEVLTVVSDLQPERKLDNPTWKIVLSTTILGFILFLIIALLVDNKKAISSYLKNTKA